jgi:hypothetical protein
VLGQDRRRHRLERGQIVEKIINRLERAVRRIAQQRVAAAFQLAGKERDAEIERDLQVGLHPAQHGETAGHVESADRHRDAGGPQRAGDIECAGKLIALHAD